MEANNAGGDGWKGDQVYQLLMQAALIRGGDAASWAANLSAAGPDVLNARYVMLGNIALELLDYTAIEAVMLSAGPRHAAHETPAQRTRPGDIVSPTRLRRSLQLQRSFPTFSNSTIAPSVAGNMHISFNVRPETDLTSFINTFVEAAHARGWTNVYCDRLIPVQVANASAGNYTIVSNVPVEDNAYFVTSGGFAGWSLAYCKGPDLEQLEFNQVVGNAAEDFDQALRQYLTGGSNQLW